MVLGWLASFWNGLLCLAAIAKATKKDAHVRHLDDSMHTLPFRCCFHVCSSENCSDNTEFLHCRFRSVLSFLQAKTYIHDANSTTMMVMMMMMMMEQSNIQVDSKR